MVSEEGQQSKPQSEQAANDAAIAVRFLLIKAAIFILIPAVASVVAVWLTLK